MGLDEAVRRLQERRALWRREGERSIGQNLAMIGALGWTIVTPALVGVPIAARRPTPSQSKVARSRGR